MFSFPYCCLLLLPIPLCWWFLWSIIPYNQPLFSTDTMLFPAPDIRNWALYSVFPSDTNGPRARISLAVLSTALSYGLLLVGLLTVFEDMAFLWNFRSVLLLLPQWAMSLVFTNLGFPSEIKRSCTWPCLALIISGILFYSGSFVWTFHALPGFLTASPTCTFYIHGVSFWRVESTYRCFCVLLSTSPPPPFQVSHGFMCIIK